MNHTLTALFDDRAEAEQAKSRLMAADLAEEQVQILDQSTPGYKANKYSDAEDPGIWATIKDIFLPDEDRHYYEEGVKRGAFLLTTQVEEPLIENAVAILDEANSIDVDERAEEWRADGWDYQSTSRAPSLDETRAEETTAVPLAEEQLKVGKRDVERGGVKVRSYVVETPVQEEVSLRKEQVAVERKPVNRAAGEEAFQERSVEMTATDEEAVVAKEAVVKEEVHVRKDVATDIEQIDETVRHTEVEVEKVPGKKQHDK